MIFVDTGAFIARYIKRDQHHNSAIELWSQLQNGGRRCFTTNFVLDESITYLARRTFYEFAADRADKFYQSDQLTILRPELGDELSAVELFGKYSDQSVSFTDCVSFVLMDKHDIKSVFTYDNHFRIAGFTVEPN